MLQHAAAEREPLNDRPRRVAFEVETDIPTQHGTFRFRAYRDLVTGSEHLAIISLAHRCRRGPWFVCTPNA